jgi:hypothetical protein
MNWVSILLLAFILASLYMWAGFFVGCVMLKSRLTGREFASIQTKWLVWLVVPKKRNVQRDRMRGFKSVRR